MTVEDVEYVKNKCKIVAVNNAYKVAPFADALVALDTDWWATNWKDEELRNFKGLKFATDPDVRDRFGAHWVHGVIRNGLSTDWDNVAVGADSGYYALAIAVLMGATKIIMLGYDMGHASDGKTHFFGDHPSNLRNCSPYDLFVERYETIPAWCGENGVQIFNSTRQTRLNCFNRANVRDAYSNLIGNFK